MEIKNALHDIFAFKSNSPQIKHIDKKNTKRKKKIQSARGPQIKQWRSPNIFGILCYQNGAHLAKYQLEWA